MKTLHRRVVVAAAAIAALATLAALAVAAPGDLDPSFGDRGIVTTAITAGFDGIGDVEIQSDGKLVISGEADFPNSSATLVRFDPRGHLDPSFGTGGIVTTIIFSGGRNVFPDAQIQSDGKIVAAGQTNAGTGAGGRNFLLARYTPDGTLDPAFGSGGIVVTAVSPGDAPEAIVDIALQPDGKIVAIGQSSEPPPDNRHLALARYNPDGSLDGSFGSSGIVIMDVAPGSGNDFFPAVALQPDGKIVAGGGANMGAGAGGSSFAFVRFNPDGSLDGTFGTGGVVTVAVAPGDNTDTVDGHETVAVLADGKILGAGRANMGSAAGGVNFALVRLAPDGTLDPSFGAGGIVTTPVGPGPAFDFLEAIAIAADGRIVAGGATGPGAFTTGTVYALARYNADGSLDDSFGSDGIVTTSIGGGGTGYDAIFGVKIQKNGKIVAAGECDTGAASGEDFCAARYKAGDEEDE